MYCPSLLLACVALSPLAVAADDADLNEIVVSATRRDTKLLETPISMTALGAGNAALRERRLVRGLREASFQG